jgi:hypothetical protein
MNGDFSRDTFDPTKHFLRVFMQQGRVLLDADWNEQAAILLHYVQTLAADLIGPHGGPELNYGFAILSRSNLRANFLIGRGRYYVDGILCENESQVLYAPSDAPELPQPDLLAGELKNGNYLVYLNVWERLITAIEDESIREVALGAGGPDTAARSKVVWQVRALRLADGTPLNLKCATIHTSDLWIKQLELWQPKQRGLLKAKAEEADDLDSTDPCIISPEAHYRGAENQLYRVEIHRGGKVGSQAAEDQPTFKWSRENASVALPIRSINGHQVTLEHLGRDARLGVEVGDWVEVLDDHYLLRSDGAPRPLLKITDIDSMEMIVTLSGAPPPVTTIQGGHTIALRNPLLRRWDHQAGDPRTGGLELGNNGAALIKEATATKENWLNLEDGIQIQFQPGGNYRAGDYWLIPARTATGDVEWPGAVGKPEPLPPRGVQHHYVPLARINVDQGVVTVQEDFRRRFSQLARCPTLINFGGDSPTTTTLNPADNTQ